MWQAVSETRRYIAQAEKLLTVCERDAIIEIIARHPDKGDVMEGTGGIRKLRFARGGRGKSGGVRVIYYYYDQHIPIFLLDIFGKNEKSNLTKAERNIMANFVAGIKRKTKG